MSDVIDSARASQRAIYFDNAATSWPKPACVANAMSTFLANDAANPGRAGHRMAVAAEKMMDRVRKSLADFVHASDPSRVIFASNGTDALNIALKGLLREGDHVVTTTLEHNSVSRPLEAMSRRGFITLTRIDFSRATCTIDPDDVRRALTPRTKLVAMTHASNVLGMLQPIEAIGKIAHDHGARFLVDAAQSIGLVDFDIEAMHVDALAFPGHKGLLGPTGTGALCLSSRILAEQILPFREGGTGGDSSSPTQPVVFPHLLEGGTPNTVGIAGLGAAIDFVNERGPARTLAHERATLTKIIEAISTLPMIRIFGPTSAEKRVGALSIAIEGYSPHEAASILDESFAIAVRPGLHCAPYAHRTIGTFPDGTLRISPGPFTTNDDVDALIGALLNLCT